MGIWILDTQIVETSENSTFTWRELKYRSHINTRPDFRCILSQFKFDLVIPFYSELIFSPLPGFEPGTSWVASYWGNHWAMIIPLIILANFSIWILTVFCFSFALSKKNRICFKMPFYWWVTKNRFHKNYFLILL